MRRKSRHLLALFAIGAVLWPMAAPSRGEGGELREHPVFFREPDSITRRRIEEGITLLSRSGIDGHTRGRAILMEIGTWAVDPLLELLVSGNSRETQNAALVLGEIGGRRALPLLLRVAERDRTQFAPMFAVLAVGRLEEAEAIPALFAFLRDPKKEDRRRGSILAVAKIGGSEAFPVLRWVLSHPNSTLVRQTALFSMGFFREQALVHGPDGVRPIPEIEAGLASRDSAIRKSALLALAMLGHRDLLPRYLVSFRREQNTDLTLIALLALGRFPDAEVTEILLDTLENPRTRGTVKMMAAFLLRGRQDPGAIERLLRIEAQETEVRAALTLALSNFESPEVADVLLARLGDRQDQVRAAAAIAVSRFTEPELIARATFRLSAILEGGLGPVREDVRVNMRRARSILESGEDPLTGFLAIGNEEFLADLLKDVEERLLDLVNLQARRVLGVESLTDLKAGNPEDRFRVSDQTSELRDLEQHLDLYPYFETDDVPEPKLTITPRPLDPTEASKDAERK